MNPNDESGCNYAFLEGSLSALYRQRFQPNCNTRRMTLGDSSRAARNADGNSEGTARFAKRSLIDEAITGI